MLQVCSKGIATGVFLLHIHVQQIITHSSSADIFLHHEWGVTRQTGLYHDTIGARQGLRHLMQVGTDRYHNLWHFKITGCTVTWHLQVWHGA